MTRQYDIFVSYAEADEALATKIIMRMSTAGFAVVAPVAQYEAATPSKALEQVAQSEMAIYIASLHSNRLRKSVDEIMCAAKRCKALFIVVTDDSSFPTAIPRPSVYKLPTIDFRRDIPESELLDRLASTVEQVKLTGNVYSPDELDELNHISNESRRGRELLRDDDGCGAAAVFADVVKRLEELPAYPPTQLAHAYSDLASAHYHCRNYRGMFEADERALALIATEDFAGTKDINYRLAVAVHNMENPSHEQLVEALTHIEAAIYDHNMVNPDDHDEAVEMEHVKNSLTARLAI